jgi:hypothetical protein
MRLLRTPHEPPVSASYIFGRHFAGNAEWGEFIRGW